MGNNYTGVQPIYRWANANSQSRDGGGLEVHHWELVPLDEGIRCILTTLWKQCQYECNLARYDERWGWDSLAKAAWNSAEETAVLASIICFDLFGIEGPEHLHSEACLHRGDCPIFEAGFEHAQDTVKDWVSNDGPWYS